MKRKPPPLCQGELRHSGGCYCLWQSSSISNSSPLALPLLNIFLLTKYPARLQALCCLLPRDRGSAGESHSGWQRRGWLSPHPVVTRRAVPFLRRQRWLTPGQRLLLLLL